MPLPITTTLADATVARMLLDAQRQSTEARQADAAERLLMLQENWRHLIYAFVNRRYKTDAVKRAINSHVKTTFNVLLQITRRVCVVYRQPPVRRLKGAPQASQDAWAAVMREAEMSTRMKSVERHVFAVNVAIVMPVVYEDPAGRGKRLRYDELLPHCTEVQTYEQDPMGSPQTATFSIRSGSDFDGDPLRTAVVDDSAIRYYDKHDRIIGGATVNHDAGVFPGVGFRLDHPVDDWWSSTLGSGVVQATKESAHLAARLDWVRFGQDRYKEIMAAEDLQRISQQTAGAEGPLEIPLAPGSFSYQALNVIASIDEHVKHLRLYLHQAADLVGVPATLVDFAAFGVDAATPQSQATQHAALASLRSEHIEWYRRGEHELAWRTALVLQGMRHPLAPLLSPEMVADTFEVEYPDLTYVEDPQTRVTVSVARVQAGLSSTIREYQREHPELTFEQAKTQVIAIAEEEGELNELYIRNNWPRGAAGKQTLAQAQGAEGGKASGEARQDTTDDPAAEPGRADAGAPADPD